MSEVYWIGGAGLSWVDAEDATAAGEPDEMAFALLSSLFKTTGARGAWVDEVNWMIEAGWHELARRALMEAGLRSSAPIFYWPVETLLDHYLLHDAARSVIVQDCHLMIFGQQDASGASLGLLASPVPVGRYNLMPRARIEARIALNPADRSKTLSALYQTLERRDLDPDSVAWFAACSDVGVDELQQDRNAFPDGRWLPPPARPQSGSAFRLAQLVEKLEEENAHQGLLISALSGQPALATLVQRI